jgi:hypothetical protein
MTKQIQRNDANEGRPLALIFLVTFGVLSLVFIGLLYLQVAQVLTRNGRCTILSSQMTTASINDAGGQTDGTVYYVSFTTLLQTPDGQHLRVPGYYGSSNYNFGDKASAQNALKQYAVGKTADCSYTYLDPSGIKALFSPMLPTEGIFFVSALLLASFVLTTISAVYMRKRPSAIPEELAELEEIESVEA